MCVQYVSGWSARIAFGVDIVMPDQKKTAQKPGVERGSEQRAVNMFIAV